MSTVEIYCCYEHGDKSLMREFEKHIIPLQRQGLITFWESGDVSAGSNKEKEIEKHLNTAHIILLLISPNFMASEYFYSKEMRCAVERDERGEACVIPILLRSVSWETSPIGKLQVLPRNHKAVVFLRDRDKAFVDIVENIKKVVSEISIKLESATDHRSCPLLDDQITSWIEYADSKSEHTRKDYRYNIGKFRYYVLHESGLDLDKLDSASVSSLAQDWAVHSPLGRGISSSTYNLRIAAISSFYKFALSNGWTTNNPVEKVKRRKWSNYRAAKPLDAKEVRNALSSIDRSKMPGKRDFALLCLLLKTGRLLSEVASLRCGDIIRGKKQLTILFRKCKGGKALSESLLIDSPTAKALLDYLMEIYGNKWPENAPVWVSQTRNKGGAISIRMISNICYTYLGTGKVQVTRNTFISLRNQEGAKKIEEMLDIN